VHIRNATYGALVLLLPVTTACHKEKPPDAYGNVEAVEVVVGAEASGRIEGFQVVEGQTLAAGAVVGAIETTPLALERRQLAAQRAAAASRLGEIAARIDTLEVQRKIASRAYERTRRLHAQQAATSQQLDQDEKAFKVLGEQIGTERAQAVTVRHDVEAAEARVAEIADRIEKGAIRNPVAGTVLATYARAGEVTQSGQPLYRIADLGTVEVRAYVVETQLTSVRVGQSAHVSVDVGGGRREVLTGTVTWVSSDAEFTPTPVQTREERADLVYALKIRVPNPGGILKIGMPADVDLLAQAASR
jgi:HlyD family secretion protein